MIADCISLYAGRTKMIAYCISVRKDSLNRDDQQFHQYRISPQLVDDQQFHQYRLSPQLIDDLIINELRCEAMLVELLIINELR
jgi:hypothetical protein